jgi:catechol 2,3-dioxygenase-like lactoylglutathione lyase family enzyme
MPLERMEHFFVLADDIEKIRSFYCDILGLRVGFRPKLSFDGYWLYLGDVPVIHVGEKSSYARYKNDPGVTAISAEDGTGPLDHIAFNATGFDEMVARLDAAGLSYRRNNVNDMGLRQLFVKDPSGICIEMNFRGPEPGP